MLWVERALGRGFRVVASRRMTGGVTSTVHRLTVERGGDRRLFFVLRQYEHAVPHFGQLVDREADILRAVTAAGLAAPSLIDFSPDGADAGGLPSVLMSRLRGHLCLTPADPGGWLGQMAAMAATIHDAPVSAPAFERWLDPARLTVPATARRPDLWRAAIEVLQSPREQRSACFIHRDFQHFNLLWARGRLTGVVDWSVASSFAPPEIDVGHCRLNLAVLFCADWAERFRLAYEAETGRSTDPWWDLHALAYYSDAWRQFIPIQVGGRVPVDTGGMTTRVEELLESALRRLSR
jgi:aminoglycoside phosphotransferase (APT) family kinase protein